MIESVASIDHQKIAATLHTLLGRAVWSIQHLEDALSHSIAIKNPESTTRVKGDEILNSNRELTLGKAVKLAQKEEIFNKELNKRLQEFLQERNWLVHKCMRESADEMGFIPNPDKLFRRIRTIELTAIALKESIEIDMLEFAKSNDRDDIVETVKKAYIEGLKIYNQV